MRRTARALTRALAALVTSATVVVGAVPGLPASLTGTADAAASTVNAVRLNGYEAAIVSALNSTRVAHHLRALVVVPGATDVARRWSWQLAGKQALSHNPSLVSAIQHAGSAAWTMIAENVGMAPSDDPSMLFTAYMNSPPHRANILDPSARFLGVGVVERSGAAWNTLDFTNAYTSSYGMTRVPAAGMAYDRRAITSTSTVASFGSRPDQRFSTAGASGVAASIVHFTAPTAGSARAYATFTRRASGGYGDLFMRDELDLSKVSSLALRIGSADPRGRAVSVQVLLTRAYGGVVALGTVTVPAGVHWFTLAMPSSARDIRDTVSVRVSNAAVAGAGGSVVLSVYGVRANV
jgi:uncharacterized protein YkwD